eukprot:98000-Chlamydomonas_euryale.AAC.2
MHCTRGCSVPLQDTAHTEPGCSTAGGASQPEVQHRRRCSTAGSTAQPGVRHADGCRHDARQIRTHCIDTHPLHRYTRPLHRHAPTAQIYAPTA